MTANRLNQFCTESTHDEELSLLRYIVQCGWPQDICEVPKEIQPYWTFHEELTIEDGILLKGTHIIVSHSLHQEMIQLLHTGHLRLEKCLNRVKQSMYWPGLYEELKRTGNILYYMFEVQLTKADFSIQQTICST